MKNSRDRGLKPNFGNKMWTFPNQLVAMSFMYTGAEECFLHYSLLKHVDLFEYSCLMS